MLSTSAAYKTKIKADSRSFKASVVINGTTYTNDNILNFVFEDKLVDGAEFGIGQTVSNYFEITLQNVTGTFDGLTVVPSIGLDVNDAGSIEYLPLGTFYVDDVDINKKNITLKCFDSMIKLNKVYASALTYPATITQVMNEICTQSGVTFSGTLPAFSVPQLVGYTRREVVGFIAALAGGNAVFNRSNQLVIKGFTDPNTAQVTTVDAATYFDFKRGNGVYTIGKVTITDGDVVYSNGTLTADTRELVVEVPWVSQAIADSIGAKLRNIPLLPYRMTWRGDPSVEAGDNIKLNELDASIINSVVLEQVIDFSGSLSASSMAQLEGVIRNTYAPLDPIQQGVSKNQLYTWIKYADTPTTGMSDSPTGKTYMGIAYNKSTVTESTNYSDYSWSLIKGDQGVAGPSGSDGQPTYTWVKYATSAAGAGLSDDPTGKTYMGLAHNKTTSTESTNPADYTWSLFQGPQGIKGDTGSQGPQGNTGPQGNPGPTGPQGPEADVATNLNKNVNFYDWPGGAGTLPTGYAGLAGTAPTKVASGNGTGNSARSVVAADGIAQYFSQVVSNRPYTQYFYIEATFMLESGVLDGSGVLFRVKATANIDNMLGFKAEVPSVQLGKYYTVSRVVKLASPTAPAGFTGYEIFPMASWSGFEPTKIKTINIDSALARPATEAEIYGYETGTLVDSWKGAAESGNTTIKGGLIQTNTIAASKLVLSDFNNYAENGDFETDSVGSTPKGWDSSTGCVVEDITAITAGNGSNRALGITALNGSNHDIYHSNLIPVKPGQQFFFKAIGRYLNTAGTLGQGRVGFQYFDKKRVAIQGWNSAITWNTTGKEIAWTEKKGTITIPATAGSPSGEVGFVRIWVSFSNNGETTNKFYIDNLEVRAMANADLIVDGQITAKKITLNGLSVKNTSNEETFRIDQEGTIYSEDYIAGVPGNGRVQTAEFLTGYIGLNTYDESGGVPGSGRSQFGGTAIYGDRTSIYEGGWGIEMTAKYLMFKQGFTTHSLFSIDDTDGSLWWHGGAGVTFKLDGPLKSTGSAAGISTVNPNNASATNTLSFNTTDNVARIRYGGSGLGSAGGFRIEGTGDVVKLEVSEAGTLITTAGIRQGPGYFEVNSFGGTHGTANRLQTYFSSNTSTWVIGARVNSTGASIDANIDVQGSVKSKGNILTSKRELKKNISDYTDNAIQEVITTPVRTYHFNEESDLEMKHVGMILDELPAYAVDIKGQGVDLYALTAILWRATQQQQEKIDSLEARLAALEAKLN